jgi:hypothetical protein
VERNDDRRLHGRCQKRSKPELGHAVDQCCAVT